MKQEVFIESLDTRDPRVRADLKLWGQAVGTEINRSWITSIKMARAYRDPEDFVKVLNPTICLYQCPEVPQTRRESFDNSHVGRVLSPLLKRIGF